MSTDIYIVLGVFIAFVAVILTGKVKIHVAAMMIPVILELTGVLDFKDAWGGMLNSSIVMMGSMFAVGAALSKTSIISRLSKTMIKPGSSDRKILIGIAIPTIFLCCFVNATATVTIMIPIIRQICAEQRRPVGKFFFPAVVLAQLWAGAIPTGGSAGGYITNNTIIENLGGVGTFTYFTDMISKIPALIALTALIIIVYPKFTPETGEIPELESKSDAGGKGSTSKLTSGQEKFTIGVFAATIIGVVFCALSGISTWYPSAAGAIILCLSGVLSDREAIRAVSNPVIFITIGTLPLATALNTTGADVLIADTFNNLTGGMSPLMTMVSMYLICMILTQFITNSAVSNAFKTMAALISVQNGYDARALMLSVTHGSNNCYLTPMAAPAMTIGYEEGRYTMKEYFKLGLPCLLLRFFTFLLYIPFVYPLV